MEFMDPFQEYQSVFHPFGSFGADDLSSVSSFGEPDSLFNQMTDDSYDDMPSVVIPQEYPTDSSALSTETNSPLLPNSASVSDSTTSASPASASPLSSPGENLLDLVTEQLSQPQQPLYTAPSVAATPRVPEHKKQRRSVEPKPSPKRTQQGTGKKRKSPSKANEEIDREALVQMSSVDLEDMRQRLLVEGRLKGEDDKLIRNIIRQVKNRESAQASRNRRRVHLDYVEAKLKHEEMVATRLREYTDQLKGLLAQQGVPVPPEPEMPVFVPPSPSEESSRSLIRPLRTASICLMLVVLSVGIFFNAMHHSNSSNNSTVSGVSSGADNGIVSQPAAPASDSNARVIVEPQPAMSQLPPPESSSQLTPSVNTDSDKVATIDVIRKSSYLSNETDKVDSSLALVIRDQKPLVSAPDPDDGCPVLRYTTKAIFGDAEPHVADGSWSLDNTSYILVNDATEFVPRSVCLDGSRTSTEPVIGLLLPASSFNISSTTPDDVVELICGVRNANLVPRSVLAHSLY